MLRREFLLTSSAASLAYLTPELDAPPLKVGHRQTQLVKAPGPEVFQVAKSIPGISGVELQVIWKGHDLTDHAIALEYKREAYRWAMELPSISGVWRPGELITDTVHAEQVLLNALGVAQILGASVILVALFEPNCPKMDDEASYGPVVQLLKKLGPRAADAGVTFGLETSLAPADDKKLITLVDHPNVRVYYDARNVEKYHPGQGLAGIDLLAPYIVQVHLKNEDRLLNQAPSAVDWTAALKAYKRIHYSGWYFLETEHTSAQQCIDATEKNLAFIRATLA